ncbi:hypothetical protein OG216_10275 [Streptomycetaceae bacterium NBC_01309]
MTTPSCPQAAPRVRIPAGTPASPVATATTSPAAAPAAAHRAEVAR